MKRCICCGGEIAGETDLDRALKALSPTMQQFVRIVARKPGISLKEAVSLVYQNVPNGGPMGAEKVLVVLLSNQRRRLIPFGFQIKSRPWSGYWLERIQ